MNITRLINTRIFKFPMFSILARRGATCAVSGSVSYQTFDGAMLSYSGSCIYKLVDVCSGKRERFAVGGFSLRCKYVSSPSGNWQFILNLIRTKRNIPVKLKSLGLTRNFITVEHLAQNITYIYTIEIFTHNNLYFIIKMNYNTSFLTV